MITFSRRKIKCKMKTTIEKEKKKNQNLGHQLHNSVPNPFRTDSLMLTRDRHSA